MAPRFLTILTGRNLPKIRQSREAEPAIINEKTIADFTRVVEQTGILEREPAATESIRRLVERGLKAKVEPANIKLST
jgi:hypothetical protein